jgi:2-polyprenyl-3-methyl-5-hydroxy-6-metoxy-1,4-benzoquinol methylase
MSNYEHQLAQEAEVWGGKAEEMAAIIKPDWRYHRGLRHNVVLHAHIIDEFLSHIQPGTVALELGCASGWLTLAMAQRGAAATGLDISEKSLRLAREYYNSIQDEVPGTVNYAIADLNNLELPADTYDIIAVKGTLHHLTQLRHVIAAIKRALKPGGLLWVYDTNGEEALSTVLMAGALSFILPTHMGYGEKLRHLLKFGVRSPSRVKASIEAEGLSVFEGAGRDHDWVKIISQTLKLERRVDSPAFTGYLAAQLKAPDWIALPLLRTIRTMDKLLVRLRVLRNTTIALYARK